MKSALCTVERPLVPGVCPGGADTRTTHALRAAARREEDDA
ncbi:hypothetical protein [Streptomyces sp. NA04227]|nr:hypothetical protein [Streptomyces sp. NA04227]